MNFKMARMEFVMGETEREAEEKEIYFVLSWRMHSSTPERLYFLKKEHYSIDGGYTVQCELEKSL